MSWMKVMILSDINVLVYAHREDTPNHKAFFKWLEDTINSDQAYAISTLVLSGFIRIVTHLRIFKQPSSLQAAFDFANTISEQPNCIHIEPGPRHWNIFKNLCNSVSARGNLVPDAYFAALAIEHGCEWITTDRDFSRFPGLNWRHPLNN